MQIGILIVRVLVLMAAQADADFARADELQAKRPGK